jgi:hypothetical protein
MDVRDLLHVSAPINSTGRISLGQTQRRLSLQLGPPTPHRTRTPQNNTRPVCITSLYQECNLSRLNNGATSLSRYSNNRDISRYDKPGKCRSVNHLLLDAKSHTQLLHCKLRERHTFHVTEPGACLVLPFKCQIPYAHSVKTNHCVGTQRSNYLTRRCVVCSDCEGNAQNAKG